ncbi:hypothetical protein BZA02_11911 [Ruegeria sp. P4]|nr:hypothetical protein BZA02_11911 [Ruegeria sp. P4]
MPRWDRYSIVALIRCEGNPTFSRLSSNDGFDNCPVVVREGVYGCDVDMYFGGMAVGVLRYDQFPEALDAVHHVLDSTAGMVLLPFLLEHPAHMPGHLKDFVPRNDCWVAFLPSAPVAVNGYDAVRASFMTAP